VRPLTGVLDVTLQRAADEIAQLHQALTQAQAAVAALGVNFNARVEEFAKQLAEDEWRTKGTNIEAEKQSRLAAMARVQKLVTEAGK